MHTPLDNLDVTPPALGALPVVQLSIFRCLRTSSKMLQRRATCLDEKGAFRRKCRSLHFSSPVLTIRARLKRSISASSGL